MSGRSAAASQQQQQRRGGGGLSEEQQHEIREAFELFDTDGSGTVEAREVKVVLRALGFEPSKDDVRRMVADAAGADAATVTLAQFTQLAAPLVLGRDPREEMAKAFRLFDADERGRIAFRDLKRVAQELGEALTDDELTEMIEEADSDGDGFVTEADFMRVMKKANLF